MHPKYLDSKGLTALWREALLAKRVLENKTRGYKEHPQLTRFKCQPSPLNAINAYLREVFAESKKRNFNFDDRKIDPAITTDQIPVSSGQVIFEFDHLLKKLKQRDPLRHKVLKDRKRVALHPLFKVVSGEVERWEKDRAVYTYHLE